jgi:molecular chaperone IbpA
MASGYLNGGYPKGSPHDQWGKEYPKQTLTTITVTPTLEQIFADQFFLGFHDQIGRWQTLANLKRPTSFPPYNLIKIDEDNYKIELAVAGYTKEDIEVSVEKDLLTVKSKITINPIESGEETKVIHQGIAERQWQQQFALGEWIVIKDATLKDGLLTIKCERELPDELKPKTIKIK